MKFYKLLLVVIALYLIGCKPSPQVPDVSHIKIDVKILNFEKDLFALDYSSLIDSLPFIKRKYGEFLYIFSHKVINIGSPDNPAYPNYLSAFLTDYNINKVKKTVDTVFKYFDKDFSPRIIELFKFYRYYFPEGVVPNIITYISGFNQSIVTSDTILAISLDKYLGNNSIFYQKLGLPKYLRRKMYPEIIPSDCARAWALTHYPLADSIEQTLLNHIIYQGKVIYFTKMLLPAESDTNIFAMSNQQIEWCKKYESEMWNYLIEKKHLFSTDFQIIRKYIEDAPFTKDFGQKSPGKAVIFIGYRIVELYVKNTNCSLSQLMHTNNYTEILRISNYKP